jgi:uncharacterized damage-inducible protein DinB
LNADGFRHLFDYHFSANRKLWDYANAELEWVQIKQKLEYSVGSLRNQFVHMFNIDERWFSALLGRELPGFFNPVYYGTAKKIRNAWDIVEADNRAWLDTLTDQMLMENFPESEFKLWQILFHVLNHGTDHRAQVLAMLDKLGVPGFPQDYFFYLIGRLGPKDTWE